MGVSTGAMVVCKVVQAIGATVGAYSVCSCVSWIQWVWSMQQLHTRVPQRQCVCGKFVVEDQQRKRFEVEAVGCLGVQKRVVEGAFRQDVVFHRPQPVQQVWSKLCSDEGWMGGVH